jgi:hypothetical protein
MFTRMRTHYLGLIVVLVHLVMLPGKSSFGRNDAAVQDQWVVVTAAGLKDTIKPLVERRKQDGLLVVVLDTFSLLGKEEVRLTDASKLRSAIRFRFNEASGNYKRYVLLVGSALPQENDVQGRYLLPALQGSVERMQGQATDNGYGCRSGEFMPDVAVGRFPVRCVEDARAMVAKTLAWESKQSVASPKRRMTILAGAPSYNRFVDTMVERFAMTSIAAVDPAWSGRAIYRSETSAFSLPDSELAVRTRTYLGEGQAMVVFLGHSLAGGIWHARTASDGFYGWKPLVSRDMWSEMDFGGLSGVFATFGCNGAELSGDEDVGYGVAAMRNPRGPVAVMGSHDECWASMSMLMSEGLLRNLPSADVSPRLGDLWLAMKQNLALGKINPILYHALDRVDGDPNTPQARQRLEHLEMFLMFGDPAIRLPAFSSRVEFQVEGRVSAGSMIEVSGSVPSGLDGAGGWLTLERGLASQPGDLEHLSPEDDGPRRAEVMRANHDRANRFVLKKVKLQLRGRRIATEVRLPEVWPWNEVIVRIHLIKGDGDAMGVQSLRVDHTSTTNAVTPASGPW